jgi:hypothetical protein
MAVVNIEVQSTDTGTEPRKRCKKYTGTGTKQMNYVTVQNVPYRTPKAV